MKNLKNIKIFAAGERHFCYMIQKICRKAITILFCKDFLLTEPNCEVKCNFTYCHYIYKETLSVVSLYAFTMLFY